MFVLGVIGTVYGEDNGVLSSSSFVPIGASGSLEESFLLSKNFRKKFFYVPRVSPAGEDWGLGSLAIVKVKPGERFVLTGKRPMSRADTELSDERVVWSEETRAETDSLCEFLEILEEGLAG